MSTLFKQDGADQSSAAARHDKIIEKLIQDEPDDPDLHIHVPANVGGGADVVSPLPFSTSARTRSPAHMHMHMQRDRALPPSASSGVSSLSGSIMTAPAIPHSPGGAVFASILARPSNVPASRASHSGVAFSMALANAQAGRRRFVHPLVVLCCVCLLVFDGVLWGVVLYMLRVFLVVFCRFLCDFCCCVCFSRRVSCDDVW